MATAHELHGVNNLRDPPKPECANELCLGCPRGEHTRGSVGLYDIRVSPLRTNAQCTHKGRNRDCCAISCVDVLFREYIATWWVLRFFIGSRWPHLHVCTVNCCYRAEIRLLSSLYLLQIFWKTIKCHYGSTKGHRDTPLLLPEGMCPTKNCRRLELPSQLCNGLAPDPAR